MHIQVAPSVFYLVSNVHRLQLAASPDPSLRSCSKFSAGRWPRMWMGISLQAGRSRFSILSGSAPQTPFPAQASSLSCDIIKDSGSQPVRCSPGRTLTSSKEWQEHLELALRSSFSSSFTSSGTPNPGFPLLISDDFTNPSYWKLQWGPPFDSQIVQYLRAYGSYNHS